MNTAARSSQSGLSSSSGHLQQPRDPAPLTSPPPQHTTICTHPKVTGSCVCPTTLSTVDRNTETSSSGLHKAGKRVGRGGERQQFSAHSPSEMRLVGQLNHKLQHHVNEAPAAGTQVTHSSHPPQTLHEPHLVVEMEDRNAETLSLSPPSARLQLLVPSPTGSHQVRCEPVTLHAVCCTLTSSICQLFSTAILERGTAARGWDCTARGRGTTARGRGTAA